MHIEEVKEEKKNFVLVKVLDLPGGGGCACSSVPRTPEYLMAFQQKCDELKAALETNFPGQAAVEFIDLEHNPSQRATEAGQLLMTTKYPSPLVLIDEEPRFAGSIQVGQIVKEVGKILAG